MLSSLIYISSGPVGLTSEILRKVDRPENMLGYSSAVYKTAEVMSTGPDSMVENLVDCGILLMTYFCHSASFRVSSCLCCFFLAGVETFL